MHVKYNSAESFKAAYQNCLVCDQPLHYNFFYTSDHIRGPIICKHNDTINHYAIVIRRYKYGGVWRIRVATETFYIDNILIIIGQEWWKVGPTKVKMYLANDRLADLVSIQKSSKWTKEFSLSQFKKRFKFGNPEAFREKMRKFKKSLVLM